VKQPAEDRAAYFRQLRVTVAATFAPELTSAAAIDAAALVDRILAEFVVEEEWGDALSQEFGAEFASLLDDDGVGGQEQEGGVTGPITPSRFTELRMQAAAFVAAEAASDETWRRARCRDLVAVEHRFLERVEELRRAALAESFGTEGATPSAACSMTPDELTRFLRRRLPGSPGVVVTDMEIVPGGRSKETIRVRVAETTELPPDIIVRKDRPVGLLETRAADEFAVLAAVHAFGGVPVPEPFFADEVSADPVQTLLVMDVVPGTKAGEYFPDIAAPTEHRAAIGRQLAAALARLHAVPFESLAATKLDVTATVTDASLRTAVEGMTARIAALSGPPIAAVPLARQWLLDHVHDVVPAGRLCLLQSDVGLHNMLIDGDRLTALVDWEAATIGPPARELAAAWPAATALMGWDEFVDAYRAAGGAADATNPKAVAFYRVFFALGACMSSRAGGDLFRTGAKRDLVTAHSGLDAHFRAQRNLSRALEEALAGE
jgi:aminoglycoside phosphotransferase (APT) family kinase protein